MNVFDEEASASSMAVEEEMKEMSDHKYERIVPKFEELQAETRKVVEPFIQGAQIAEIITGKAHGVVETTVSYLRGGKVFDIIYDETTHKVLGGSEPAVVECVLGVLSPAARAAVTQGGERIRKIKIKHDEKDDREWIHAHYVDAAGNITSRKLEINGLPKN